MPVSHKLYQVVSGQAVMVENASGNSAVYPTGEKFEANPNDKSIIRLLRINAIREVTKREIPNFNNRLADGLPENQS